MGTDSSAPLPGPPCVAWHSEGTSVIGVSHIRAGLPNQDAVAHHVYSGQPGGLQALLAVSDGHGSAKCFRSQTGARLAVETACRVLEDFFATKGGPTKGTAEQTWPRLLVAAWRAAVWAHASEHPLRHDEPQFPPTQDSASVPADVPQPETETGPPPSSPWWLAYGATLLVVVVADSGIYYLQLGDGDILAVAAGGAVERRPRKTDPRLLANDTTSLCMRSAAAEFRFDYHHPSREFPRFIMVSTDGYSNAFKSDADFLKVGRDLHKLCADGTPPTTGDMEGWLNQASEYGSGDDVSLAYIWRQAPLQEPSSNAAAACPTASTA